MHDNLKSYLDIWNEAHQKALFFFEALPAQTRNAVFGKVQQAYKAKAEKIIQNYQNNGAINTRILLHLIDFLPIEQAHTLYRYEIWHFFASLKPANAFQDEVYTLYAKFLENIKEAQTFDFKWFQTQKYKPQDLAYLYEAEKHILLRQLAQECTAFQEDLAYIQKYQKSIKSSVEYAVYTTYFTGLEVKMHASILEKEKYEMIDVETNKAYIAQYFQQKDIFNIDTGSVFTAQVAHVLADLDIKASSQKELNFQNFEANKKHLHEIITNYKKNNALKHLNTTQAEFEMYAGKLDLKFSTQQFLFKKYVLKAIGVFCGLLSLWGLSVWGKIFGAIMFPFQWYLLFSLISLLLISIRWIFKE